MATARQRLLVEHPLQPFAAAYFTAGGDARIISSNQEYCDALKQLAAGSENDATVADSFKKSGSDDDDDHDDHDVDDEGDENNDKASSALHVHRFFSSPLPAPEPHWHCISLDQLQRFFANPCRYLLQQRLGMRMIGAAETLQDNEPFIADWNGLRALEARLLPLFLDGVSYADIVVMAQAGNELPSGLQGRQLLQSVLKQMQKFVDKLIEVSATAPLPIQQRTLAFDIDGEHWSLTATFTDLRANGLIRSRYDDTRPVDYLSGWIDHLAMNAAHFDDVISETLWLSRDGSYRLRAIDSAHQMLSNLIRLYRYGLTTPLHFFPKAAWAFQHNAGGIAAARKKWLATARTPHAEQSDPAYQLALRGIADALDDDFECAARTIFGPVIEHVEDVRL